MNIRFAGLMTETFQERGGDIFVCSPANVRVAVGGVELDMELPSQGGGKGIHPGPPGRQQGSVNVPQEQFACVRHDV